MNSTIHDPYLNTAKRSLRDKYYKEKINIAKEQKIKPKSFLRQNLYLSDYINLSEEMASLVGFTLFALIPYFVGILFVFLVIAKGSLYILDNIQIENYFIYWSIGYELLALFILFMIAKSAIKFRSRKS
jgi:hypothetical protein